MSMIFSIWTVFVFVLFMAIVIWAYSGKQKQAFDEAARLPLDDLDNNQSLENNKAEKDNG